MQMRTPLRPFRVQSDCGSLTPGVVTAFLRPWLPKLRPFGVRVCANHGAVLRTTMILRPGIDLLCHFGVSVCAESGYGFTHNDEQCLSRVPFITITGEGKFIPLTI